MFRDTDPFIFVDFVNIRHVTSKLYPKLNYVLINILSNIGKWLECWGWHKRLAFGDVS